MSIYSGFATRFQQQSYDHCIDSLLYIMQKRIIKFYQNQQADQEKFISLVLKLHQQMKNMQKNKYLDPKSSHSIHELIKFMQIYEQSIISNPPGQKQEKCTDKLPQIQHKTPFSENGIQKKKSPFWVQKKDVQKQGLNDVHENKQKSMTINNESNREMHNIQSKGSFRKTSYNQNIKGIRIKNSSNSKSKLDQYKIVNQTSNAPIQASKNRSKSNYLQEKPNILQSKVTYYAGSVVGDQNSFQRKRKVRSNAKVGNNQTDTQENENSNEVADIIKQYILKARKNYMRGTRTKQLREGGGRINDF